MEKLIYGAAYYPEYEPIWRVEKDLHMMKKAGMNTIRIAESTWSTWEPKEGRYDFSILKDTLDICEKEGMQVIIGTPTYAVPSWLIKKDPSVMVTTKEGRALYGYRQLMDIMNPTYRQAAERIIQKMMETVSGYGCVIGYQLDNETKHYGTSSEHVQQLFKEYLKNRFGTVEKLNRAFGLAYWSNSIADWEDLPDIRGTIRGSLAAEFEKFQRHLASEFLKWQRKIVDRFRRPDQFVTHNFDFEWRISEQMPNGYSYGVQPGINHQEASDGVTVCGTDIYHPSQDNLTGAEIAFCGDSIRSLKGKHYIVLETQAQCYCQSTPYPGQLRQQALSHLASGAIGVEYWHWHSAHNGVETFWKGILSHDLAENAVYRECEIIGRDFEKLLPVLQNFTKKNCVALLVDNLSLTALEQFPVGGQGKVTYNDIVRCYFDSLYKQNIECDVIDVQKLPEKIKDYGMIVVPALYAASDETVGLLHDFVENGGTLVSSFKSFFADENVKVRHERQPYHMTDVFGMYYQEFVCPEKTTLRGKAVDIWAELIIPEGAAEIEKYEHRYWGTYAAVTKNNFGKGHAYYIGCWCDQDIVRDILKEAAEKAGVPAKPAGMEFPLIVRSGTTGTGAGIHFIFNYSEDKQSVSCPYEFVKELLTDREFRKGEMMEFSDWSTMILEES